MIRKQDVRITRLPVHGESQYIMSQVERVMSCNSGPSRVAATEGKLIEYIVNDYVAPQGSESLLSIYLSSENRPDPAMTTRLTELVDLCVKLQTVHEVHTRQMKEFFARHLGDKIDRIFFKKKLIAFFKLYRWNRNHATDNNLCPVDVVKTTRALGAPPVPGSPGKARAPPLPYSPVKVSDESVGKVRAPPLPPTSAVKAHAAPIPNSPGKAQAPAVPGSLGKVSSGKAQAPPNPASGKAHAPPTLPGKFSPGPAARPSIPVAAKCSVPPPDVPIFDVPLIDKEDMETRKLHWQSIPVSRFKESVFDIEMYQKGNELNSIQLNLDLVKSHFVKSKTSCMFSPSSSPSRAPTAASSPMATSASLTLPSVLETRRIQQVEIFLNGRKGLAASDIVSVVQTGGVDESVIDLLEAVGPIYPTPEERTLLEPLKQRGGLFGKADTFLLELMAIPEFKIASNYVVILHTGECVGNDLLKYFSNLTRFIAEIQTSKSIVILLKIVGSLIVYLWNGKKVNFNGFSIDLLSQLKKNFSFADREYSMLNYLVDELGPARVEEIISILSPIESLLELDFADALARSEELERSVHGLKPTERLSREFYKSLIPRLERFKLKMTRIFEELNRVKQAAIVQSKDTLRYFAESEKKNVNEFLASLNLLRIDLNTAQSQNEKRRFRSKK